eukprot:g3449.t1
MNLKDSLPKEDTALMVSRKSFKKQLSSKSKLAAFPLSFLHREKVFRLPIRVRNLRTSGPCKIAQGLFGFYRDTTLNLEDTYLSISTQNANSESSTKKISLVGASLAVLASSKFTITTKKHTFYFKFDSEMECSQWLYSFQHVAGLYRRVEDFYQIGAECGQGATCVVYECFSILTGQRFALKKRIDPMDELGRHGLYNELRILQLMAKNPHSAIPHLEDHFYDKKGDIQLIMEFLPRGELSSKIKTEGFIKEEEALEIFKQVADGVRHLHENCIAHRDLKPSNIMLGSCSSSQNFDPRIIDYDLAKVNYAEHWYGSDLCGTPEFMAPEIHQRKIYTLAVDVWSLGCVLYVMLIGKCPFRGENSRVVRSKILNCEFDLEDFDKISPNAKDLILKMLEVCPEKRITAQQVMKHPWLTVSRNK